MLNQLDRSQDALQKSEERYRVFLAQSSEGIWRCELEQPLAIKSSEEEQIEHFYQYGYVAECNKVLAHMFGYLSVPECSEQELVTFCLVLFLPMCNFCALLLDLATA
jgi:PAS domain-containing protein